MILVLEVATGKWYFSECGHWVFEGDHVALEFESFEDASRMIPQALQEWNRLHECESITSLTIERMGW